MTAVRSCVHSPEMPLHSHTYIFMSSYPPGPIVEKEAVSITGRKPFDLCENVVFAPPPLFEGPLMTQSTTAALGCIVQTTQT